MKAEFVFENINDLFKPKNMGNIKREVLNKFKMYPDEFKIVLSKILDMGYKIKNQYVWDNSELYSFKERNYTYQGKIIDFHFNIYIDLPAKYELRNMDHFYNDSLWKEDADIEQTSIVILKIRSTKEIIMDGNTRFNGYWPCWEKDEYGNYIWPDKPKTTFRNIYTEEEIKNTTEIIIKKLNDYANMAVDELKKYADRVII